MGKEPHFDAGQDRQRTPKGSGVTAHLPDLDDRIFRRRPGGPPEAQGLRLGQGRKRRPGRRTGADPISPPHLLGRRDSEQGSGRSGGGEVGRGSALSPRDAAPSAHMDAPSQTGPSSLRPRTSCGARSRAGRSAGRGRSSRSGDGNDRLRAVAAALYGRMTVRRPHDPDRDRLW